MAEKILNTRILMKIDTLENWSSSSLKLKDGELAFATVAASAGTGLTEPVVMVKIGTSEEKTFSELPWAFHAKASDVLAACKSEAGLKAFVNSVIADAGIASSSAMEALSGRVTTAEGKITGLENELNTAETGLKARMTTAEGAIDALELLVGEKNVATQIQEAIAALKLGDTYEVKGEAAKVQTALNEYKTSNDAAVQKNASDISGEIARAKAAEEANANAITAIKDGTAMDSFKDVEEALAGKEAAGEAAKAQAAAEAHADSLNTAMDARVQVVEGKAHTHTFVEAELNKIADGDVAKWNAAEQNAKDYVDGEIEEWVGDKPVGTQITEAITGLDLANTYAAKVHKHVKADITDFAHTHEMSEVNGLEAALEGKQAAGDYATKTEAQAMADGKDAAIKAAKDAADAAQADVDALELYVGTIPETAEATNIVAYVQEKTAGIATDTALEELTGRVAGAEKAIDDIEADYLKAADKTELQGAIDALEGLVGEKSVSEQISAVADPLAARVKVVEDDYLKAADKTELQGNIDTVSAAVERLTNGVSAEEVDGVNDLIQYVKDHGTEVTGMKNSIKANSDAIDAIEADYLKAADKTALEGKITAEENRAKGVEGGLDTRLAAVEAAVGESGSVAGDIADALTEAKGYTDAEVKKLAEGAVATNTADIAELEGFVGGKNVSTQINEAIEALKIGDYAKAADLTAAINQHNTDKAALEGAIALKANDADLAAIAKSGNVNDLVQTQGDVLIFDCGTSAV